MDLKRDKKKTVNLYSITDWEYHKGKVNWDDFFDKEGKFFLTIATMKMAKEDGFLPEDAGKAREPFPKRIFIQEKDKTWTVYEDLKYFSPKRVQKLLNDLGGLMGKKFTFKYKVVPKWWKHRLARVEKEIREEKWVSFRKL